MVALLFFQNDVSSFVSSAVAEYRLTGEEMAPPSDFVSGLTAMQHKLLAGFGGSAYIPATTTERKVSSYHLKNDAFVVAASLLDPRNRSFDWCTGSPGEVCARLSTDILRESKFLIQKLALDRALGKAPNPLLIAC